MSMQTKSAAVEIKTNTTPGEFTAVFSMIGNVDRQGDRVMPGAFKSAIDGDPCPPCYWAHMHHIPPIGEGIDWFERGKEVHYQGRLFVSGDDAHQYAQMVYPGMKSFDGRPPAIRQFSYTYGIQDGGAERVFEDGKAIRNLLEIRPVAEVGPCFLGANSDTYLPMPAKSADGKLTTITDIRQMVLARKALGAKTSMKAVLEQSLGIKDWGDIDAYEISYLLDMLDSAVYFIQFADEPADVAAMQGIAVSLVDMLRGEIDEVTTLVAQAEAIDTLLSSFTSASTTADAAALGKKDETPETPETPAAEAAPEAPAPEAEATPPADAEAEPEAPVETEVTPPVAEAEVDAEAPTEATGEESETTPPAEGADDVETEDTTDDEKSQNVLSDLALTVKDDRLARVLLARPTHES